MIVTLSDIMRINLSASVDGQVLMAMLPFGVIGRTQSYFGGLPVLAEITHHQLIVATALASESSLFFAGLLHDVLKPLLHFEKGEKGWRWKHLYDVKAGDELVNIDDVLSASQLPSHTDIGYIIDIIKHHHDRGAETLNPISYVESRSKLGLPVIEATLLPRKELERMGLHVCVEASGLKHPYHFFVLNLLYQGLKYRLNKVYGELFSKHGVNEFVVDYFFGEEKAPEIRHQGSTLFISYFIPSEAYKGLHVMHKYGPDLSFSMASKNGIVNLEFGWSDILTFIIPYIDKRGARYRITCIIPGSVKRDENNTVIENQEAINGFRETTRRVLEEVISEIEREIGNKDPYGTVIVDYLEGKEQGEYSCLFCGRKTAREVRLDRDNFLPDNFTDYHRVSFLAESRRLSICPICHVGFIFEKNIAKKYSYWPSFLLALPAEPVSVKLSRDFKLRFTEPPINVSEGIVPSILGLSTLQLLSHAWYLSLLKETSLASANLLWLRGYSIRDQKSVNELHLRYMVSRRALLYPLEVKIRPRALISSYSGRGRSKKFILNTDIVGGQLLWKGSEHDLTEEQLDALEPLLEELAKANIRSQRKIYSRVVDLYGLR